MHENSIDVYHVDRLHYPRHAVLPSRGYLPIEIDTQDTAVVAGHLATHRDFALSPIGKPLFPVIDTLTDEERERSYIILVPPTLLIILNSDSAFYRIVRPRGAETIDIHQTLMVPESYRQVPNFKDLVAIGASMHLRLNHQDYMVDSSLQRAAKSRVAARGPYSWQEGPVAEFDSWVARRYQAFLAARTSRVIHTVGVIGLGVMGAPMAANLVAGGFDVVGFSRRPSATAALEDRGGKAAATIADAVTGADVVITVLSDGPAVAEVVLGEHGVLAHARPGLLLADMSTIDVATTREVAEAAGARGVRMLDAPVSGGEQGAIDGTLSIMVGGDREDFEAVLPVFAPMGRTIRHLGPIGTGQIVKAANQLLVGGTLAFWPRRWCSSRPTRST